MPEYKLIYFNGKGRAELARWIFEYCGIKYTDERFTREEWPEKKKSIPGGKVPVLMVDDKYLPQSLAIARYVAKIGGLIPEDPLQAAFCDALGDTLSEMMGELGKIIRMDGDEEAKTKKMQEEFVPNTLVPILTKLNSKFEGTGREWLIGNKISWSDLFIGYLFSGMRERLPKAFEPFPGVTAHVDKVCNLPAIKDWIARRPVTPF